MTPIAAGLPRELFALVESLDLSQVRSDQAWVLSTMRRDGPAIIRMLWRLLTSEQDVLDAYQDCFCKLLALSRREGRPPNRGYVFKTALNVAVDVGRQRKVQRRHMPHLAVVVSARSHGNDPAADSPEALIEALRAAIASLPDRLRDIIVLRDLAELSYREVAAILGLTPGTARVYRREAIIALSARMGADQPGGM